MIGIVGITKNQNAAGAMLETLSHRGKHNYFYEDDYIAFGKCTNNRKKIYKKDGYVVLIDGTLNYKGKKSQEEYILGLYKRYKLKCFTKLKGTFALCIYDVKNKSIVLARDKMGVKPLYYAKETFCFASEIKALLKNPAYDKKLNGKILADYFLYQTNPDAETLFKGIYKVQPGSYVVYQNGNYEISNYYTFNFDNLVYDEVELQNRIKKNIQDNFTFDKKVASFLSSGIDSSLIVSASKPKDTYTVSYEDNKYSEASNTKELARILGINNHIKIIKKDEFLAAVEHVQYAMDEPCLDPAVIALYFGAQEASKKYDYVCSGEGSDELFAGYNAYNEMFKYQKLSSIPEPLKKVISTISQNLPEFKGVNFLIRRTTPLSECYAGVSRIFNTKTLNKLLKVKGNNMRRYNYHIKDKYDNLEAMQIIDIHYWLKEEIHATERMCATHSVEAIMPYLNDELLDIASIVPSSYKLKDKRTKVILRDVAKEFIPNDAYQNKKLGFPVPVRSWLRSDEYYIEIKKAFNSTIAEQFFDTHLINKWLEEHHSGKKDYTKHIWSCYSFLVWYNKYFIL